MDCNYDFSPADLFSGESSFELSVGGTTYEISTHFSADGRQSVLEQFMAFIQKEQLL